jgi:hypothetical protein
MGSAGGQSTTNSERHMIEFGGTLYIELDARLQNTTKT